MATHALTKPGISISLKRREIKIFRNTIEALGNPKYIRLLIDFKKKKFALQALQYEDKDAFIVPTKEHNTRGEFPIYSMKYVQLIWFLGKWEQDYSYRIYGKWNEREKLLEFLLDEAVLMSEGMEIVQDVEAFDCDDELNNYIEIKED